MKKPEFDDMDSLKIKKKTHSGDEKVNIKSRKFWDEIYEDEEDNFDKLLRE
ncbi:MAG: hypothetical protein IPK35_11805 [Saprospiraceae bacterium]|nr:hypothetical protein [Saprospiraceae bacterium]